MALAIAVLFPAAVYVWLLRGSFTGKDTNDVLDLRRLSNYLFSRNGLLAFGAGVVAAFGVFSATYLSAATWDPTAGSYIALLGGTFSAFVAAATTVSAAGADRSGANL
jgi:hypothetical protein